MPERNPGSRTNGDVQERAKSWLLPEQVDQMRSACLTDRFADYLQERNLTLVELMYDTGLRASEVVGLDVDHLHLDEEPVTVYLPSEIQKGNPPPATIELSEDTARQLRRYLRDRWKDTPALFPTRSSDRMTSRSLQRTIEAIAVAAEVEPHLVGGGTGEPETVTPHTLRHSVAYRIIRVEGGRLEDVQLRLRHKSRSTTDRVYSHLVPR
ncbi:tyrosine-type recombinase/integrase [Halobacteriaceae archaeon GCM10025711]